MIARERHYPSLVKSVRDQLGLSQEGLARELGVSFATVNRWENGKAVPSILARNQIRIFCDQMAAKSLLKTEAKR